jgi:hypothetical protein
MSKLRLGYPAVMIVQPSKPIGYFGYAIFGHQEGLAPTLLVLRLWAERFLQNGIFEKTPA